MKRTILNAVTALVVIVTLGVCGLPLTARAAVISWDGGGGANQNWSTTANWNPDGSPSGNSLTFDNTAAVGTQGTVNNIVDSSVTVNSLGYTNSGASFHTTQIGSGVTLTINGSTGGNAVLVGGQATNTTATITGAGTLNVNSSAANFRVDTANSSFVATLDMSGLANFVASVANFQVAPNSAPYAKALVKLAMTNTITASTAFSISGNIGDTTDTGTLSLGTQNTINTAALNVGQGKGTGLLNFQTGLVNPSITIRGAAGGSTRADVNIGAMNTAANAAGAVGTVDLTGGTVDALLGAVAIGYGSIPAGANTGNGTLTFNAGTIDATSIELGRGLRGNGFGTLNIGGGTLIVATNILGNQTETATGNAGTINLRGGTLQAMLITNGAGSATRTINWNSGTIQNRAGGDLAIAASIPLTLTNTTTHPFNADASRTITVNSVIQNSGGTSGGGITKAGAGSLTLGAVNTYTGSTIVNAGTVTVTGSLANNGSSKVFLTADPTATFVAAPTLVRNIPANSTYAGYGASSLASLGSTADIRAGSNTTVSAKSMTMQWGAGDLGHRASDILNLTGLTISGNQTDPFALQMTYTEAVFGTQEASLAAAGQIHLDWLNGGAWVNGVLGNIGAGGTVVTNYQGPWTAFATANSITDANVANFLGSWGVDTSGNAVWAVLNHNSEFEVSGVPEPSTLLLFGLGGMLLGRRVRRGRGREQAKLIVSKPNFDQHQFRRSMKQQENPTMNNTTSEEMSMSRTHSIPNEKIIHRIAVVACLVGLLARPVRVSAATNVSGNVASAITQDTITASSVTNTAAMSATATAFPSFTWSGTNVIGADVSASPGTIKFLAGSDTVQTGGNVSLPARHILFDSAHYLMNAGSMNVTTWFALGTGSTFVQNGGTFTLGNATGGADIAGLEQIAGNLPGTATLLLSNGTFNTSNMLVGNDNASTDGLNRRGVVVQEAGSTVVLSSNSGRFPGTSGDALAISITNSTAGESSYTLKGGSLTVANANTHVFPWGQLGGYGTITTTSSRTLDNSGQVVADGFGVDRTLNLSQYGTVVNSLENGTERTGAGWYAQNHGKVTLPSFAVAGGSSTKTWGESTGDTTIDLVNSARLTFTGVTGGTVSMSLLSTDRTDVPVNPSATPIGVWDIDGSAFTFGGGSVALTLRYDDAAASAITSDPSRLAIFHYTGGQWQQLATTFDGANFLVSAAGITSFSDFEVAVVPEPSTVMLFALGGVLAWRRVRGGRQA